MRFDEYDLVSLEYWRDGERNYSIYVRHDGSQFLFLGKKREEGHLRLLEGFRHTFFLDPENPVVVVGNKNKCIKFLQQQLPSRGCPDAILSRIIIQVKEWSSK